MKKFFYPTHSSIHKHFFPPFLLLDLCCRIPSGILSMWLISLRFHDGKGTQIA